MIIHQMTASFGRLNQERLVLEDGLNVIQAPNEGGKSTWAGFLKAMFYGIPTRDRDKKGYLADKNRYQPWSGVPMEGELELEWGGRNITLRRFSRGGVPFGGFSAVYTGTGEAVPGLTGDTCGPLLLGAGREVFERSAFIGQGGGLSIDAAPELERRIASLISSGEEDVSFSQAQGKLRQWMRRRRHNRTGLIPRLEQELEQARRSLERMEEVNRRSAALQARHRQLERRRQELEQEEQIHRRLLQRELNLRYLQARQEWEQARGQLRRLEKEQARYQPLPDTASLSRAQEQLRKLNQMEEEQHRIQQELEQVQDAAIQARAAADSSFFAGRTGEEAKRRAEEDIAAARAAAVRRARFRGAAPLLLGGGAVGLLLLPVLRSPLNWLALAVGAALAAAGGVCLYLAGRAQEEHRRLLQRYRAQSAEDVAALAEDYLLCRALAEEKQEELESIRKRLRECREGHERLQREVLDFVGGFAPEVSGLYGCSAALSYALGMEERMRECAGRAEATRKRYEDLKAQGGAEADTLEALPTPERTPEQARQALRETEAELAGVAEELARSRGELDALGDPAALDARAEQLSGELERRSREYDALALALEGLEGANACLRERFSPALERCAGEILSQLTAGRYDAVTLDREFEAAASGPEERFARPSLALSGGTREQIYLAVRLAVCRLCLPQEDPAPLVLDDALVSFDDGRMALALDCLAAQGRQVLLFTCQEREGRYLKGRPGTKVTAAGKGTRHGA